MLKGLTGQRVFLNRSGTNLPWIETFEQLWNIMWAEGPAVYERRLKMQYIILNVAF